MWGNLILGIIVIVVWVIAGIAVCRGGDMEYETTELPPFLR